MNWDRLTKPAAALYRARVYFILGALLLLIQTIYAPPFQSILSGRAWYHDLVDKGLGSLDKAAYIILLAGIAYAVLADVAEFLWTNKIQDDLRSGFKQIGDTIATGVSGITYQSIISWMETGARESSEYRAIGVCALTQHYGDHSKEPDSHLHYVLENLLDQYALPTAMTRKDFRQTIIIRKVASTEMLQWEDEKRYTLICPAGKGQNRLRAYMSCRATPKDVKDLVGKIDLTVYIDRNQTFSFKAWAAQHNISALIDCKPIKSNEGTVSYDGHWLILDFSKTLEITKAETQVRIVENSFISLDDRCYNVILDQPTYKMDFSMRLEGMDGWSLMKPIVGATWYHSQAAEFATIDRDNQQWVSVSVPKWVFPGVVLAVEWAAP